MDDLDAVTCLDVEVVEVDVVVDLDRCDGAANGLPVSTQACTAGSIVVTAAVVTAALTIVMTAAAPCSMRIEQRPVSPPVLLGSRKQLSMCDPLVRDLTGPIRKEWSGHLQILK